jgi:CcmD family protein
MDHYLTPANAIAGRKKTAFLISYMKQLIITLFVLLCTVGAMAQDNSQNPVPTGLRADGKIYVVIAVLCTIVLGLFVYVWTLDRKISKLEKK